MAPSADPTKNGETVTSATEVTPLLTAPASVPEALTANSNGHPPKPLDNSASSSSSQTQTPDPPAPSDEDERPMPHTQILVLCYASLAEPVAYFAIFPFINEMIFRLGQNSSNPLPESSVGFWSGLIESLFSLVQMVLMIFYGRAADRYGRKPVLVFSLTGIAAGTALFGMGERLWQMVVFRCFAGCFAGCAVTIRTMISENCTKRAQARAFSWYMFTRNLGIFVGPLIGTSRLLARPPFPTLLGCLGTAIRHPGQ